MGTERPRVYDVENSHALQGQESPIQRVGPKRPLGYRSHCARFADEAWEVGQSRHTQSLPVAEASTKGGAHLEALGVVRSVTWGRSPPVREEKPRTGKTAGNLFLFRANRPMAAGTGVVSGLHTTVVHVGAHVRQTFGPICPVEETERKGQDKE